MVYDFWLICFVFDDNIASFLLGFVEACCWIALGEWTTRDSWAY